MIKINLLPQKRPKRAAGRSADPSSRHVLYGIGGLAVAAVAVFLLVDKPLRDRRGELAEANEALQSAIRDKNKQLVGYAELQKAKTEAEARAQSINRLMRAKVVPAHVLHELGEILTSGRVPTMTAEMAIKTSNQPGSDPNKRFQIDWDPTRIWLSGFSDSAGAFKLEGGAQSESDVTQLSKRLAASIYFMDVTPAGGERVVDSQSGLNYYKFTITGKVAY
ncbi:MAG: PilN domain-containing protein [Kofleriaceae bacterium]